MFLATLSSGLAGYFQASAPGIPGIFPPHEFKKKEIIINWTNILKDFMDNIMNL